MGVPVNALHVALMPAEGALGGVCAHTPDVEERVITARDELGVEGRVREAADGSVVSFSDDGDVAEGLVAVLHDAAVVAGHEDVACGWVVDDA